MKSKQAINFITHVKLPIFQIVKYRKTSYVKQSVRHNKIQESHTASYSQQQGSSVLISTRVYLMVVFAYTLFLLKVLMSRPKHKKHHFVMKLEDK